MSDLSDHFQDARLRELAFLTKIETDSRVESEQIFRSPVFKSMLVHLLHEGYVNGLEIIPAQTGDPVEPNVAFGGKSPLLLQWETRVWEQIRDVLANQGAHIRPCHKGRVRRSELEQALRTGRDREPFGILWAERHRDQAVIMAVLTAQRSAPVSLCYLDMNGLKGINDRFGHHAGDEAIRTYLQTIATICGDSAEGFRSGGADEVVVVMRATSRERACEAMRAVLRQLAKERVLVDAVEAAPLLAASCGVASTEDPAKDSAEFIKSADQQQRRAKDESKRVGGGSFLAFEGGPPEKVSLG